jgi:hypothetical protein
METRIETPLQWSEFRPRFHEGETAAVVSDRDSDQFGELPSGMRLNSA